MKVDTKQLRNEENIKLVLYKKLSTINDIDVFGDYRINRSRCDLVVTRDNEVLYGIEVKRTKRDRSRTRQYKKYESLNIPIVYCCGYNDVDKVKGFIEDNLYNLDYLNKSIILNAV